MGEPIMLDINRIVPDPRREAQSFEPKSLAELSRAVARDFGDPVTVAVSPVGEMYILLSGEMRYAAALCAGLTEIPATVISYDVVSHGVKQPSLSDPRFFVNTVRKYADFMGSAGHEVTLNERDTADGTVIEIFIRKQNCST